MRLGLKDVDIIIIVSCHSQWKCSKTDGDQGNWFEGSRCQVRWVTTDNNRDIRSFLPSPLYPFSLSFLG